MRDSRAAGQKCTCEIDFEYVAPGCGVERRHWCGRSADSGVAYDDVDATESLYRGVNPRSQSGFVCHIAYRRIDLRVLLTEALDSFPIDIADRDMRTAGVKRSRNRQPDAGRTRSYQRNL